MTKHDEISSLFWLSFGAFIIIYSIYHLDIGVLKEPGPGFFLLASGIGVCLISIMIFTKSVLSKEKREGMRIFSGIVWVKPALVLAILSLYIYFFRKLGFILDTFLLMVLLFKCVEPQSWSIAILYSFLTVLVTWLIFGYWFEVQFPAGLLSIVGF